MDRYITRHWEALCASARMSGKQLGQVCSEAGAELMRQEVAKFCDSPVPATAQQLDSANIRRMSLSARLTAIARAEGMARTCRDLIDDVFAAVRQFCDGDLAADGASFLELQRRNLELTSRISELFRKQAGKSENH